MNILRHISEELNFLACPNCNQGSGRGINDLCDDCRRKLVFFSDRCCRNCGGELDSVLHCCSKCVREGDRPYSEAVSVFAYHSCGKEMILKYKTGHLLPFARIFSKMLCTRIRENYPHWDFDMIVPIPLYWSRKFSRTFNQSQLLAEFMARELQTECCPAALKRVKNTRSQKFLSDFERRKNMRDAFKGDRRYVKNKTILLVDDIFTTGTTMSCAADELLNCGAKCIYAATVGRA